MDLSKIAKLIAELRKEKGVTQREIAEKLGVPPQKKPVQNGKHSNLLRLKYNKHRVTYL